MKIEFQKVNFESWISKSEFWKLNFKKWILIEFHFTLVISFFLFTHSKFDFFLRPPPPFCTMSFFLLIFFLKSSLRVQNRIIFHKILHSTSCCLIGEGVIVPAPSGTPKIAVLFWKFILDLVKVKNFNPIWYVYFL